MKPFGSGANAGKPKGAQSAFGSGFLSQTQGGEKTPFGSSGIFGSGTPGMAPEAMAPTTTMAFGARTDQSSVPKPEK